MEQSGTKPFIIGILFMVLLFFFSFTNAHAQWAYTYGGSNGDFGTSIQQTTDEGYVVAGYTESFGAGDHDAWVMKLDASGNIAWQKTYGGSDFDYAISVQQTTDSGYIVAGGTESFGAGSDDVWIIKLDAGGTIVWQKTYGGSGSDIPNAIIQTDDGFIVAGASNSFSTDNFEAWIIKLDSNGNRIWERTYGGTGDDFAFSIQQTTDSGYIVAGATYSFGASNRDVWVLKLDENGNVIWQKRYGGIGTEGVYSAKQTSDGGYILAGDTESFGDGSRKAWIIRLDQNGVVLWEKIYGGTVFDRIDSIEKTQDGGYIAAGRTLFGNGAFDAWLLKIDSNGGISWQKTYGGSGSENAYMVQPTSDNGYIVAGDTYSFANGRPDYFLLKLDSTGSIGSCPFEGISTALVTDTAATVVDTDAVPITSTATVTNTTATVTDTTATPLSVCNVPSGPERLKIGATRKKHGDGTITSLDGLIDCPDVCETLYNTDISTILTATPAPLSTFLGWKPTPLGCETTNPVCPVTMDKKKSVKAVFQGPNKLKVVISFKNGGTGTVTSSDTFIICPVDCEEPYILNAPVTLTANVGAGSTFVKWTGKPCKDESTNVCTLEMNKNATVKALFEGTP
jgi:hypothetical protein